MYNNQYIVGSVPEEEKTHKLIILDVKYLFLLDHILFSFVNNPIDLDRADSNCG